MSQSRKAPRTQRQLRKATARVMMALAKTRAEREAAAFTPIINEMHPHGNRRTRRYAHAVSQGRVGEGWKRKKRIRGEYYGRKLDSLIRSGAPMREVQRERIIIRALLA